MYKANNTNTQGPESDGFDADFEMRLNEYPNYPRQWDSRFPNLNVFLFGENIFYVNQKLSIILGFRFEYIKTERDEIIKDIVVDVDGNMVDENLLEKQESNERNFILLGIGTNYKFNKAREVYGNISQNYRAVTFSDISTANPAFDISTDITDEKGFTIDTGIK